MVEIDKNYVVYHLHSDLSNGIMMDSTSKFEDYIKKAKEYGMKAIGFSEHGVVYQWIEKKMKCDQYGIKYIHGMEAYITTTLKEKKREYYHLGLYARNWEGVKEINRLSSLSFNKQDNHFYYRPRLSIDDIKNTSDNIIITTACLGSIFHQNKEYGEPLLEWMAKHKDRCFLEIQYHNDPEQIEYNQYLYRKSQELGIPLIAGTDTHVLDEKAAELRLVLQKSKNIEFNNESTYDLTFKSYDQLVEAFERQGSLPMDVVIQAIENTNILADMVEEFKLDTSHKYPKLYPNANQELKKRVTDGLRDRGVMQYPPKKKKQYFARIREEVEVIEKLGAEDYFLLLDDIIRYCREHKIATSPRGSCNGSLMLWALRNTDIDSIKYGLPFFRFLNPERVSMADVDVDMSGKNRDEVKDFLYNYPGVQGSAIITYQTYQYKGAVRGIGRGLGIPLKEVDIIAKDIEEVEIEDENGETKTITTFHNKDKWTKKYPKLMELVERAIGIIENVSVHACGFVVTDRNIDEEIGTFRSDNSKWPISQNNMSAIDAANFVKMDLLVVDNVQMVQDVCELAGIDRLDNDKMNFEDEKVWREMLKSGLGIFQFEKSGWRYLRETLLNYPKFKELAPNATRLDLMTALNGIIRPAGDSIRDKFIRGIQNDNGMKEINEFLGKTLGYLIYQEQIMMFLHKFCNYSMGQADIVRRGIAKKKGTQQLIPEIKKSFIEYNIAKHSYPKEHLMKVIDRILKIIDDASDYGFSENHSCPYSILGFKGAYLRHYYPLEFLTVQLRINEGKIDKTAKIIDFIKNHTDIEIKPIQFRKSRSDYMMSKEDNAIYKGMKSIKYLNEKSSEELYELRNNRYNDFIDLLIDIRNKTSLDTRQKQILIKLDFFREFGGSAFLLKVNELFEARYKKTLKTDKTRQQRLAEIRDEIKNYEKTESISIFDKLQAEQEYLGYIETIDKTLPKTKVYIKDINTKYSPKLTLYQLATGKEIEVKMSRNVFYNYEGEPVLHVGDIIQIGKPELRNKRKKVGDQWVETNEKEYWLSHFKVVERAK